ncbi:uncharacterized protein RHOBADRAFT_55148 [Rhodotorula graminis WP1]|uniref:JmjC domain-containing protein n=1 Tax=Rhodotorula graminis (strain WP1) TaxID=578459 RepID=A0A0P9EW12_RHOGW|nr:uncharacterized protein RHOBADRAFT_55148 [Rhodotorula graminis WP1]KPV73399.1 hypothetical protein RHOBADRAFT_55148 [Rhodotorula graminis WP1]
MVHPHPPTNGSRDDPPDTLPSESLARSTRSPVSASPRPPPTLDTASHSPTKRRRTLDPKPSPPRHPHSPLALSLAGSTATAALDAAIEQPHPPADHDAADELERVKNGAYGYLVQDVQCCTARASHPLKPLLTAPLKCQACTSRHSGFTCAFVGLRSFPLDRDERPQPYPAFVDAHDGDDERPVFPLGAAPAASSYSNSSSSAPTFTAPTSTAAPPSFNSPLTPHHAHLLRTTAATHLPAHLALELAHAHLPTCARVARRTLATRTTCDGCNAAVLSGSWICTRCGREYCLACGAALGALAARAAAAATAAAGAGEGGEDDKDEGTAAREDKLTRCKAARPVARHALDDLVPLARIPARELRRVQGAMERWVAQHGAAAQQKKEEEEEEEEGEEEERARAGEEEWDAWVERHRVTSGGEREAERGRPSVRLGAGLVPPRLDEGWRRAAAAPRVNGEGGGSEAAGESDERDDDAPPGRLSQEALFRKLWARGEPILVDLEVLERSSSTATSTTTSAPTTAVAATATSPSAPSSDAPQRTDPLPSSSSSSLPPAAAPAAPPATHGLPALPWSPAFLAAAYGDRPCTVGSNTRDDAAYGDRPCTVGSNTRDDERHTTVGRFFAGFGKAGRRSGREGADWPAAKDFREYPELWHDFMDVLPAGAITRRDGVLNISAHVPVNANPPDLGPKGYFSEISDDGEGGNGSTKLHMVSIRRRHMGSSCPLDVADAVNILMWASDMPDGLPGVAIWDLYAAEDADKIRDFLYGHIAKLEGFKDADEARKKVDDPIHTQRIFLSAPLRAALLASHGVRSFRILQRPNEAVFIPAGCAHQVCNLSNCIKVATDFVSVENVARCWKLSDEFHAQTKSKSLWCPDVLELKSMLLWAWYSAERLDDAQDAKLGSTSGANGTTSGVQDVKTSGEEA